MNIHRASIDNPIHPFHLQNDDRLITDQCRVRLLPQRLSLLQYLHHELRHLGRMCWSSLLPSHLHHHPSIRFDEHTCLGLESTLLAPRSLRRLEIPSKLFPTLDIFIREANQNRKKGWNTYQLLHLWVLHHNCVLNDHHEIYIFS